MDETMTHRRATRADLDALRALMDAAIAELQKAFLDPAQIASSRSIMGLDTQLIDDGTYFVVEIDGQLAGCGGWSRRATLYGSDQSTGRSPALLDPATDAARVRAMYTHPHFARRGVGRLILALCEEAARAEGFRRLELMGTLAGEPLYRACGYEPYERVLDDRGGAAVPLVRMRKSLSGDGSGPITFDTLYARAKSVINPRRLSDDAEAGSVGAALLAASGAVYVGVCIDTACSMGFCAEHAAAAAMVTAGENRVLKMVAVNKSGRILPPCGRCREFISQLHDENLTAEVLVADGTVKQLRELLPYDWRQAAG